MYLKRPAPSRVFSGSPSRIHQPLIACPITLTSIWQLWSHILFIVLFYSPNISWIPQPPDGDFNPTLLGEICPPLKNIHCTTKSPVSPNQQMPNEFGVCMVYGRCCTRYDGARQAWVSRHFCIFGADLESWVLSVFHILILSGQIG